MKEKKQEIKIDEAIKGLNVQIAAFNKMRDLLNKYKDKKILTDEELKEIQQVTCYNDIAFCCGIEKECLMRNCALEMLGITQEKFQKEKSELVQKWIKTGMPI